MGWFTFDVDFEMYGKDLGECNIIKWVCKILGKTPQVDLLMNFWTKGEKISKSKTMVSQ